MDYNLVNGGLIAVAGHERLISDMSAYRTTFRTELQGMCWFMNASDSRVYYSDQRRKHSLCFLDLEDQREYVLLERPVCGIVRHEDWLYYVSEDDGCIYRCDLDGRRNEKLFGESARGFILEGDALYAAANRGIVRCRLDGSERETVSGAQTSAMVWANGRLAFADRANRGRLTLLDVAAGRTDALEDYAPAGLNTDGRYLYCSNWLSHRSVYRIDPEQQSGIRICGASADYLHVIGADLYFCLNREWYRMSLAGGQPRKAAG